jgi:hypothetical protein
MCGQKSCRSFLAKICSGHVLLTWWMMAREQGNAKSAALVDTPYPSAKKTPRRSLHQFVLMRKIINSD